ncbi:Ser-Thr-rich glycosyl-phosphatidyl-inositol-anchored membrane family-domain-containing protein [Absidia repens]|uniref:Ser-Thr-rich glycosyl-phosphatidyl-inositol-anchored membrane family-domain-containing protein n=1 Tax=Absidia repens TaxID=90262 RepID=A0A1X2IGF8_9FUNG|nr:Ser-Thr-rich glycosyl-phosphatidyl-inositol-anchored membrane family-domain-containing protein [Absidia repens]
MKLSAIVAAALISVVSAQSSSTPIISVTAPLQGASYKAGDKAVISWINPTVDSISQIVLAKGSSNALQPVTTIASNVKADSGSYTWNIPADTPAGSDYAFEFGTSPNLAFTGQFSITAGSGGSSNSSSSASGSGSSASGSSSSSASGSGSSKPSGSSSASGSGSSASGSSGSSSSGSDASASGSSSGAEESSSSAANSLTAGSVAAVGAAVVAVAQLF